MGLKLMIYSGDDDSVCGQSGTQYWLNRWDGYTRDLDIDWLPWRDEELQLGGYYTIYHSEADMDFNALHFITVRSAGHMVPTTQPKRALTVLKKFLYEISDYQTPEEENGKAFIFIECECHSFHLFVHYQFYHDGLWRECLLFQDSMWCHVVVCFIIRWPSTSAV